MPFLIPGLLKAETARSSLSRGAIVRGCDDVQVVSLSDFDPHTVDKKLNVLHDLRVAAIDHSLAISRIVVSCGVVQQRIVHELILFSGDV